MSDPKVDRWKHRGRLSVWKHKFGDTRWNLAADQVACDSMLELFELLKNSRWPSRKSLKLVRPKRTATRVPEYRATFAQRLIVKYPKSEVDDDFWAIEVSESIVTLVVGTSRLQELRDAILDMKNGGGDYTIGSDDFPLWIW